MIISISDIAARSWILELSPTDGWIDWNTNISIFILGLIFSILITKVYIRRVQNKWLLHQLEIEKKVLRLSLEQSDLNVFLYDPITKILEFKSQGYSVRKLDYQVKNVPESLVGSLVLPEFEKEFLGMYQAISDGVEKASCTVKVCIDGKYLWERITLVNVPFVEKGWKNQIIGMVENITEEKENEYKLENERQYREAMIAKALSWIEVDLTNNRMISVDGEAIETSEDYETFFRKLVHDRVYIEDIPHILDICSIEHLYTSYYQNGISNFQVEYRRWVNGNWIWSLSSIYLTLDTQIGALKMMLVSHDNNARKMEEIKLVYRAERDLLTSLYNRSTAENLIDDYIKNHRDDYKAALILIDLDNFKLVNDRMGHLKGDEVLQTVANILKDSFRSSDIISRLGGDEFVVFMKDLKDDAIIYSHMKELVEKLQLKYENENISIQVSGSIGIALVPEHGEKFKELYKKADAALYHVKEESKNGYYVYREE